MRRPPSVAIAVPVGEASPWAKPACVIAPPQVTIVVVERVQSPERARVSTPASVPVNGISLAPLGVATPAAPSTRAGRPTPTDSWPESASHTSARAGLVSSEVSAISANARSGAAIVPSEIRARV
jgi:hypothetical protein